MTDGINICKPDRIITCKPEDMNYDGVQSLYYNRESDGYYLVSSTVRMNIVKEGYVTFQLKRTNRIHCVELYREIRKLIPDANNATIYLFGDTYDDKQVRRIVMIDKVKGRIFYNL